jgi:hypothetical protein
MKLKRFNENWEGDLQDRLSNLESYYKQQEEEENLPVENFQMFPKEPLRDAIKRAKTLAMKKGIVVKFNCNGIPISVNKSSDSNKIEDDFVEKYNNKYPKYKKPKKAQEKIFKVEKDSEFRNVTQKAINYAKENDIVVYVTFNGIKKEVNKDTNLLDLENDFILDIGRNQLSHIPNPFKSKVEFNTTLHDVVGLPSGQILYMTTEQITWMKARNYVTFKTTWKRPISGGGIKPVELNKYVFEDAKYTEIIEKLDIIWH